MGVFPTLAVPHVPPLWRESRVALEAAQLLRSPVWRGEGVERGYGRGVLLVPGFMAGDGTLGTMAKWLRANGYWTRRAGIRSNIDCSERACELLEERLEALADRTGRRVAIVGQSRGGLLARAVAVRRPDLVSGIVTLGAPTVSMLRVHPLVLLNVGLVGALGTGRVPGMFTVRCLRGPCCADFRTDLVADFPRDVRYVSLYSRSDGIVDWHACLDPAADERVEVRTSHCGMAVNRDVYEQVAASLTLFWDQPGLARAA
jgi:pimeloyl-ACP methyl ester carboxylesterase